jgi:RND family efflux transporter MFP subunit
MRLPSSIRGLAALAAFAAVAGLTGCGDDNRYVAPPPPVVTVMTPEQKTVTLYLEATGNTAAVNSASLVARIPGFVQEIKYRDGDFVKEGTPLFIIEPEPYRLKVEQAQGAEDAAKAALIYAEAEFKRQMELIGKQVSTQALYDKWLSQRDADRANVIQAQSNTQQATINYGYTTVKAPFDGIVTARLVSIGAMVGATSPTQLASIVQVDPIYVNFNLAERDVLIVREEIRKRSLTPDQLKKVPVEVGLQTDAGYPIKGTLDYASPTVDASTGTLLVRGIFQNPNRVLLPGYFVRVRVPFDQQSHALLVPDVALGSDQGGRYLLVVNKDNVVEQRKVEIGPLEGEMRVIDKGISADDRVLIAGIMRAIPGQKVDPRMDAAAATPPAAPPKPPAAPAKPPVAPAK